MAADCGFELRKTNVAFVSLWPGTVGTEEVLSLIRNPNSDLTNSSPGVKADNRKLKELFEKGETPEFAGQCVARLAVDPGIMKKSGKIVMTYDLGVEYGLQDEDDHVPIDICSVKGALQLTGHAWMAGLTPSFIRIPKWVLSLGGNKFY